MISGIPYFGEQTQEITNSILNNNDINYEKEYDSLYSLIVDNIDKHIIVIIDNKWLTWLNDIVFNYRDKECYIPYYTYKLHRINDRQFKSNNNGHLILIDNTLYIRYEYSFNKKILDINNFRLKCINIDTMESFEIYSSNWIDNIEFDLDKLYKLYIDSCYSDDDFSITKHSGGYHYIEKSVKGFQNKEKKYREIEGLNTFTDSYKYEHDYRDVRQYKYNEVVTKYGMLETTDNYKVRRLKFECYLYCLIRGKLLDNIKFNNGIYKIGDNIKLIIKKYWLDDVKINKKTYNK